MEIAKSLLTSVIAQLLLFVLTVMVTMAIELIRRKIGVEGMKKIDQELSNKQSLASTAVQYVQQAYSDLDGAKKYDQAATWLSTQANAVGLKMTSDEIKGLIEASLRELKDNFRDEWTKATTQTV